MAIQAEQQQFCDTMFPLQLCNINSNLSSSGVGWIAGRPLLGDDYSPLQLQQGMPMTGLHPAVSSNLHQNTLPPSQQYHQLSLPSDSLLLPQDFSFGLDLLAEKQMREIDILLQKQSESLRIALEQHMKQHLFFIVKFLRAKAWRILKQKDEEIAKAKTKSAELEEWLRRADVEIQTWQRIAKEHEATAMGLTRNLEEVKQQNYYSGKICRPLDECPEAETSSSGSCSVPADEEEALRRRCKWCESRESCFLFLPCRHLCCCGDCERMLESCPVCGSGKQGAIEIFMA